MVIKPEKCSPRDKKKYHFLELLHSKYSSGCGDSLFGSASTSPPCLHPASPKRCSDVTPVSRSQPGLCDGLGAHCPWCLRLNLPCLLPVVASKPADVQNRMSHEHPNRTYTFPVCPKDVRVVYPDGWTLGVMADLPQISVATWEAATPGGVWSQTI